MRVRVGEEDYFFVDGARERIWVELIVLKGELKKAEVSSGIEIGDVGIIFLKTHAATPQQHPSFYHLLVSRRLGKREPRFNFFCMKWPLPTTLFINLTHT